MQAIWDLTVPEHENYMAGGIVNHNSGKTVAVGGCFCEWLRDYAQDGEAYWVISQTHETTRDIPQKTIWELLPHSMFQDGLSYQPRTGFGMIPTLHLNLPNGRGKCEVWFKPEESDIKVFESARLSGIWWTESRREVIWDALQPRLVKHGAWILMDYLPTVAWLKFRIRLKSPSPQVYWSKMCMADNAHNLSEGAIDMARSQMTEREARVRIDGEEGSDFGVVYPEFETKKHVCERFDVPSEWPRYRAYDYGYANPFAMLYCTIIPTGFKFPEGIGSMWEGRISDREILLVYRELYLTEMTIPQQANLIIESSRAERFDRLGGRIVADPSIFSRNQVTGKSRSIAEEFRSLGIRMKAAKRKRGLERTAQIALVRRWFESNKLLFFDTCENAVFEHQAWRYKANKEGKYSGREPLEDKDDHLVDCLLYLLQERLTHHLPTAEIETAGD